MGTLTQCQVLQAQSSASRHPSQSKGYFHPAWHPLHLLPVRTQKSVSLTLSFEIPPLPTLSILPFGDLSHCKDVLPQSPCLLVSLLHLLLFFLLFWCIDAISSKLPSNLLIHSLSLSSVHCLYFSFPETCLNLSFCLSLLVIYYSFAIFFYSIFLFP